MSVQDLGASSVFRRPYPFCLQILFERLICNFDTKFKKFHFHMNCGGQNNSDMAKGEDSAASFIKLVKMILFQCIKNRKILKEVV